MDRSLSAAPVGAGSPALSSDLIRIVDSALDATCVVDSELRPLHFNPAFATLVGLRAREILRHRPAALCHERLRVEACSSSCFTREVLRTGHPVRLHEVKCQSNNLTLIVAATPIRDAAGAVVAVIQTYRDVTAEARMQVRFKKLLDVERDQKAQLQSLVDERTTQLRQSIDQLKAARSQLVHMEKMSSLGMLVAGIAHELNNPVNFIYGNVEFLREDIDALKTLLARYELARLDEADSMELEALRRQIDLPWVLEDLVRLTGALSTGAERISAIVKDLRIFSHGGSEGDFKRTDLNQGIQTTINLVSTHLRKANVELIAELGDLPWVECNGAHVNQVLMNLIMNSIQAVGSAGKVCVRTRADGLEHVVIEVADNGSGINPEHIEKVFDPFFTTKEVGTGTGLGLSISASIVRAHRGTIDVKSAPGEGATFTVRLPVRHHGR